MLIITFGHSYAGVHGEEGQAGGQYGQGPEDETVYGDRDERAGDNSDGAHELGEETDGDENEDRDRDQDEEWETSSIASKSLILPPNYWVTANRLSGICYKPSEVRTFMGHMTVPHLKALCSLWHLPKTGNKGSLLERLYDHLMDAPDSPTSIASAKCDNALMGTKSPSGSGGLTSPDVNKTLPSPSSPATSIPCKRSSTGKSPRKKATAPSMTDVDTPAPRPSSSYSVLLSQLNDEYARYNSNGWRPFQLPPVTIGGESLRLLEYYDWDYTLPYPWILERKLSPPVMISLLRYISMDANGGDSVNIEVLRPTHAGARLLLVAIKYRTDGVSAGAGGEGSREEKTGTGDEQCGEEETTGTKLSAIKSAAGCPRIPWPPKEYRHAYIRDFQCTFDGLHYGGGRYETSTVHQVTSYLTGSSASGRSREPTALWTLRLDLLPLRMIRPPTSSTVITNVPGMGGAAINGESLVGGPSVVPSSSSPFPFPAPAGSGYFLQIVSARRDPEGWLRLHQRAIKVRPASQVMAQIRRDFYSSSKHGISTSAITISLRCPLSLQRMVTPVRSRRCRHPQCWELESSLTSFSSSAGADHQNPLSAYEPEPPIYRCPVCDVSVAPDALYVDGLVREMLLECPRADEVIIDTELGTWRAVSEGRDDRSFASSSSVTSPSEEEEEEQEKGEGEATTLATEKDRDGLGPRCRPTSRSGSRSRSRSAVSIVDLTVTPDEPMDPTLLSTVYFKTDPGTVGGGDGRTQTAGREGTFLIHGTTGPMTVAALASIPSREDDDTLNSSHPAVILEEADVVQSEAWYLTAPLTGSSGSGGASGSTASTYSLLAAPHGQRRRGGEGTSAFDAIIID